MSEKKIGGVGFILWVLLGVFLLAYCLITFGLVLSPNSVETIESLNMDAASVKNGLIIVTLSFFGVGAFLFLLKFMISVFQWSVAPAQTIQKKENVKSIFWGLGFFILFLLGLTFFYSFIDTRFVIGNEEEEVVNFIKVSPYQNNYELPIRMTFEVNPAVYKYIKEEDITKYEWDLTGNGEVDGRGKTVSNNYSKSPRGGSYKISLNIFHNNTKVDSPYLSEFYMNIGNVAVVSSFRTNKTTGEAPLEIQFDSSGSVDPDGSISFYEWDFDGDGIIDSNEANPKYVYARAGNYKPSLKVTGTNNDTDVYTEDIEVKSSDKELQANFLVTPKKGVKPLKISMDASKSETLEGKIISYEWLIAGGTLKKELEGLLADYLIEEEGSYTIELKVTNDQGVSKTSKQTVEVLPRTETGTLVIETFPAKEPSDSVLTGPVPFKVEFDAGDSDVYGAKQWFWDFDSDGIIDSRGDNVSHTFTEVGRNVVTLVVVDAYGKESKAQVPILTIYPENEAILKVDKSQGSAPLLVHFDATESTVSDGGSIINYIWKLPGKSAFNYIGTLDYEFPLVGQYEVTVTAVSSNGSKATTSQIITVQASALAADFDFYIGENKNQVIFDGSNTAGDAVAYEWDFGDGQTSTQKSPRHLYLTPGAYDVTLKVTNTRGIIHQKTEQVLIRP